METPPDLQRIARALPRTCAALDLSVLVQTFHGLSVFSAGALGARGQRAALDGLGRQQSICKSLGAHAHAPRPPVWTENPLEGDQL